MVEVSYFLYKVNITIVLLYYILYLFINYTILFHQAIGY